MANITLVDDDENIVTSVSLALESHGHAVKSFFDGVSGLAALEADPPDLAILDVKMPRMDGMEVLRRLRQSSDLPVIILTSKDDEIDQILGFNLGAALPQVSRARLQALIASGHVTKDGARLASASARAAPGAYEVELPPPEPAEPEAQAIPLTVLYEDDQLIVVDKPAGMAVHPAPGSYDRTLVNALLYHCAGSLSGVGGVARPCHPSPGASGLAALPAWRG